MAKKGKGVPSMIPIELYRLAGIDPKTGAPTRASGGSSISRQDLRNALRVMDEQDAINRYRWYNLPSGITGQFLERMLYYRYTLCIFRYAGKFYITPFALEGTIDFYGRFNTIHPVPLSYGEDGSEITDKKEKEKAKKLDPLYDALSKLKLKVIRELSETPTEEENVAVIIQDYSPQRNPNMATPRQALNEPMINMETDILQFLRTAMITSSGVKGIRVHDADESVSVMAAAKSMEDSAKNGVPFVPMITKLDAQDLGTRSSTSFQDYLLALQSIDNFRMSMIGVENGGIFQKKEHKLQNEQDMNSSPIGLVQMDGLSLRQEWCNIVNSVWEGSAVWCEPEDAVSQGEVDYEEPEEEDEGGEEDVL